MRSVQFSFICLSCSLLRRIFSVNCCSWLLFLSDPIVGVDSDGTGDRAETDTPYESCSEPDVEELFHRIDGSDPCGHDVRSLARSRLVFRFHRQAVVRGPILVQVSVRAAPSRGSVNSCTRTGTTRIRRRRRRVCAKTRADP